MSIAETSLDDETRTVQARHMRIKGAVHSLTQPAFKRFDDINAALAKEIDQLREKTTAPPLAPDVKAEQRNSNILDALARMPADSLTRAKLIVDEIEAGRLETAQTVLTYPPYASGLDATSYEAVRAVWRNAVYKKEFARLESLERVAVELQRAGSLAQRTVNAMYSPAMVEHAIASAKAADDAIKGAAA